MLKKVVIAEVYTIQITGQEFNVRFPLLPIMSLKIGPTPVAIILSIIFCRLSCDCIDNSH